MATMPVMYLCNSCAIAWCMPGRNVCMACDKAMQALDRLYERPMPADRFSIPKVDVIAAKVEDIPPTVPTGRRICYWCRGALAVEIRHDVPTCAACIKRKPS